MLLPGSSPEDATAIEGRLKDSLSKVFEDALLGRLTFTARPVGRFLHHEDTDGPA
jgi:hypothetical protein